MYAWYHFSGTKKAVDASRTAAAYYQQTKDAIVANAPKDPNEALDALRRTAHSYLVVVPGARPHVDAAFDTLDGLRATHGEDVNRILSDGYEEVHKIVRDASALDENGRKTSASACQLRCGCDGVDDDAPLEAMVDGATKKTSGRSQTCAGKRALRTAGTDRAR